MFKAGDVQSCSIFFKDMDTDFIVSDGNFFLKQLLANPTDFSALHITSAVFFLLF
jgi:hypothetical protein